MRHTWGTKDHGDDGKPPVACAQALAGHDWAGEDWAGREVAQTANDGGVTSFWANGTLANGTQWVLCDRLVGADAPPPVLVVSGRSGAGLSGRALLLRPTLVSGADGEPAAVRLVAGGRLPRPVEEIGYSFPDGHTENAAFVRSNDGTTGTWWSVTYTATDGVLVDPGIEAADPGPLVVSVVGGAAEAYRLPWGEAVRAQRSE